MNIRTKVITTIIAMVCSLSVSGTGIAAILIEFPIKVASTTSLIVGDVCGDLYGERYGANNNDLKLKQLFKNGAGVQTAEMTEFCQDVSFSTGSHEIRYEFKFILSGSAESGALIELTQAELTNSATYIASYKYAYGQTRPDWGKAQEIKADTAYSVSNEQPYIWLLATLKVNEDNIQRLDTSAVWSFTFSFSGITQSADN